MITSGKQKTTKNTATQLIKFNGKNLNAKQS